MSFRAVAALVSLLLSAASASAQPLVFSRTDYANDSGARGVVSADFNGDGYLDLATGNTGRNTVTILLNRGAAGPGFALAHRYTVSTGPFEIAAADFNKDGFADLAVAAADADHIDLLLGKGDGDFWPPTPLAAPGNPRGLIAVDLNKDGKNDIVFTSYLANTVTVLYGDGAGNFPTRSTAMPVGAMPQGVGAGDFNIDGRLDLIVANTGAETLTLLTATAAGGFERRDIQTTTKFNVLTVVDMNNDSLVDVVAAATSTNYVAVFTNSYSQGLRPTVSLAGSNNPRGIVVADVNKDGRLDIAAANRGSSSVTIWTGTTNNLFKAPIAITAGSGARDVVAGDFDHDGRVDLATGNETAATASVLWNKTTAASDGIAWDLQDVPLTGSPSYGGLRRVVDFNHNGIPDFLLAGGVILDGAVGVLLPPARPIYPTAGQSEAADFNEDGHMDIVVTTTYYDGAPRYTQHDVVDLFLGDGAGHFSYRTTLAINSPRSFVVGDVNGDGHADIVVIDYDSMVTHEARQLVFNGHGDGSFASAAVSPAGTFVRPEALRDLNRDGHLDLLLWNWQTSQPVIMYGDGAGHFPTGQALPAAGTNPAGQLQLADFNEDGLADPAMLFYNGSMAVWMRQTDGSYAIAASNIGQSSHSVVYADFTGDGHLDLATDTGIFAAGRGDGTFGDPTRLALRTESAVPVDFNHDGRMDLAIGAHGRFLMILYNRKPPRANVAPIADAGDDFSFDYVSQFDDGDQPTLTAYRSYDPNLDPVSFEWRDANGALVSTEETYYFGVLPSGRYEFTLVVRDDKGAASRDSIVVLVRPYQEIVVHPALRIGQATAEWIATEDATAAEGSTIWNPNQNTPKVTTASANPTRYIDIYVHPDPSVEYKLWVRLKAENNNFANDSLFMQFSGAVNAATGAAVARIGTTSALELNLEECSGCGVSGWGWRDEAWGARGAIGSQLLKFTGPYQLIRIQTREDGVKIDQIVLSSIRYKTTRPGATRNDTVILANTEPY
jgi:hypothetical protein